MIYSNSTLQFESEEFDQNSINTCSVPQCVVTRNTLSKWRIAAMELFEFPSHLPMTLYTCSESEKEKWIAGKNKFNPNFLVF